MDKTIFNYLVTKPNIARAAAEMPQYRVSRFCE